jgi:hypothetical protein
MITKTISTEHGDVVSSTVVSHTDNGQVVLHIVSKLGDATHEHRVTVGAEDGKDKVSALSEAELQETIQKHLDEKRDEAAQVLVGRARVAKISANLV